MLSSNTVNRPNKNGGRATGSRSSSTASSALDLGLELQTLSGYDSFHLLTHDGEMLEAVELSNTHESSSFESASPNQQKNVDIRPLVEILSTSLDVVKRKPGLQDSHFPKLKDRNLRRLMERLQPRPQSSHCQKLVRKFKLPRALRSLLRRWTQKIPGARQRRRLLKPLRMRVKKCLDRITGRLDQKLIHIMVNCIIFYRIFSCRARLAYCDAIKVLKDGMVYLQNTPSRFRMLFQEMHRATLFQEMHRAALREDLLSLVRPVRDFTQKSVQASFLDTFPLRADISVLVIALAHVAVCVLALCSGYAAATVARPAGLYTDYPGYWEHKMEPDHVFKHVYGGSCQLNGTAWEASSVLHHKAALMWPRDDIVLNFRDLSADYTLSKPDILLSQPASCGPPRVLKGPEQMPKPAPTSRPEDAPVEGVCPMTQEYVSPTNTRRNITAAREARKNLDRYGDVSGKNRRQSSNEKKNMEHMCPMEEAGDRKVEPYEGPLKLEPGMPENDVPIRNITAAREAYRHLMNDGAGM